MSDGRDSQLFEAYRPEVVAAAVRPPVFAALTRRARRRQWRRRLTGSVGVIGVLSVALSAVLQWLPGPGGRAGDPAVFATRAQAVADAYVRSGMAFVQVYGFVPTQELTTLTAQAADKPGTFHLDDTFATEAQYQAFLAGRFKTTLAPVPGDTPGTGFLVLPGREPVEVPLVSAYATYLAMDRADAAADCQGDGCEVLNVIGAKPGSVPIAVDGGEATVPAWIFTVEGLRSPIARVAVAGNASSTEAVRTIREVLAGGGEWGTSVERAETVGGDRYTARELTLAYTRGGCDKSGIGEAHETPLVVVVDIHVESFTGFCSAAGIPSSVNVSLAEPLGSRVLLTTAGSPLPLS